MSEEQLKDLVLNPDDILVTRVVDYFTKKAVGKMNTEISNDATFDVGIVKAVGDNIPKVWIGKIIYYHSNLGTPMKVKGIGNFELFNDSSKLMVRLDQNKSNY